MQLFLCLLFMFIARTTSLKSPKEYDYYYAAVVEYNPLFGNDGNETIHLNAQEYAEIIKTASQDVDIIVFPEAALAFQSSIFMNVPCCNGSKAPADDDNADPILRLLSSAAKNNSIYVAVNLHEEDTSSKPSLKYNTNVVFDREGKIIARYRKYNLYGEVTLNRTKTPEHIYFDTDFGVRFGTFTCFDILFEEPALKLKNYNVTDYIFPTWWFSELPFLTAVQEQAAWAYATDSNLLAAGGNLVDYGSSGSGIYAGKRGPVIYIQSNWNETRLLVAKLYKKNKNGTSTGEIKPWNPEKRQKGFLKMKTDKLESYSNSVLTPTINDTKSTFVNSNSTNYNVTQNAVIEQELCHGSFCCHFKVNMTLFYSKKVTETQTKEDAFNQYKYRLAAFDAVRSFDGFAEGRIQVCGIIPCLNDSLMSCGLTTKGAPFSNVTSSKYGELYLNSTIFNSIVIKTSQLKKNSFAVPSIIESSLEPDVFGTLPNVSRFNFTQDGTTAELHLQSNRLGTAAIYTRYTSPSSAVSFKVWYLYIIIAIGLHFI